MGYATPADLRDRLGETVYLQLTDDRGTGIADDRKAAEALAAAEAEIDSHLACRYAVPVNVTDEPVAAALLRNLAVDLAGLGLHGRRGPVPGEVRRRGEAAVRFLEALAAGRVVLPLKDPPVVSGEYAGLGRIASRQRRISETDRDSGDRD